MNFIARWLATAVAVAAAAWIVPGIDIVGGDNAWIIIAAFALVLSLVNIGLKPILQTLSLPLTFLTFGIFYLIVNTLLLYIASWLTDGLFGMGLHIATFGSAFVASIVISIVSSLVNSLIGDKPFGYMRLVSQCEPLCRHAQQIARRCGRYTAER